MQGGERRAWGDGGNKTRVHEIADIHYLLDRSSLACSCGVFLQARNPWVLESMWDDHRGHVKVPTLHSVDEGYSPREDDPDVTDFLRKYAPWFYAGEIQPATKLADEPASVSERLDLIDMLMKRQSHCTCDETGIVGCPNYIEGDEEDARDT